MMIVSTGGFETRPCAAMDRRGRMRQRAQVPPAQQWRLEDLYPSDQAWEQAKRELAGRLDEILQYKGKLTESAGQLLSCLKLNSEISKAFGRLHSYASMKSDEDTRNATYLAMKQETRQLITEYSTRASFPTRSGAAVIEPEIVTLDSRTVEKSIAAEPDLKVYRMYLFDVLRSKPHTLSKDEEKLLARTGQMADGPGSIYTVFSNAGMPYPQITLSDGTAATLNKAGYALHRAAPNRADRPDAQRRCRAAVFQAFWSAVNQFRQTFGVQLYSHLQTHVFYARARNYESSPTRSGAAGLHRALDKDNIPLEVYHSLIRNVRANLDTFHRYLRLKQRMLGVDTLKYSDLYAPVVKGLELKYTIPAAPLRVGEGR